MLSINHVDWLELVRFVALYPFACWTLFAVANSIYRVTLHPLAKFPGPKLAGASYCYEFWYEVIYGIQYTQKIIKLHEQYGMWLLKVVEPCCHRLICYN